MSKKRKIIVVLIILVLAVSLAGIVYFRKTAEKKRIKLEEERKEQIYPVRTAVCLTGEIYDFIKINGSVIAEKSVDVNPDTGGKLKALYAGIGDYVKKGEIIAEVDPSKPGLSYTSSPVRAPIEGTVTMLPLEAGSTVSEASVIASIGDLSELRIETEIPEPEISKIKMGSESITSFAAYPGRTYQAHVVEISPVVNPLTRTMKIKLEFIGDFKEIKAGMFGSVRLITEKKSNALLIPSASVVVRDNKDTVFIIDNDRVRKKEVITGISSEGITEVISGIRQNDIVVAAGQNLLEDGVKVNILKSSVPPADKGEN